MRPTLVTDKYSIELYIGWVYDLDLNIEDF
jgi:hypothetical protein